MEGGGPHRKQVSKKAKQRKIRTKIRREPWKEAGHI